MERDGVCGVYLWCGGYGGGIGGGCQVEWGGVGEGGVGWGRVGYEWGLGGGGWGDWGEVPVESSVRARPGQPQWQPHACTAAAAGAAAAAALNLRVPLAGRGRPERVGAGAGAVGPARGIPWARFGFASDSGLGFPGSGPGLPSPGPESARASESGPPLRPRL